MYITFASAQKANKAEPTLALKPRGDITRNPKQGYQWPQKRTCVREIATNHLRNGISIARDLLSRSLFSHLIAIRSLDPIWLACGRSKRLPQISPS